MNCLIKNEIGPKGEVCNYHTITKAVIDFGLLPDESGNGGSKSVITLSTFTSKEFYFANRGNESLAVKQRQYLVDIVTMALVIRYINGDKSVEHKAYDIILEQDAAGEKFFQDAIKE